MSRTFGCRTLKLSIFPESPTPCCVFFIWVVLQKWYKLGGWNESYICISLFIPNFQHTSSNICQVDTQYMLLTHFVYIGYLKYFCEFLTASFFFPMQLSQNHAPLLSITLPTVSLLWQNSRRFDGQV